jgi:hypothetical protein
MKVKAQHTKFLEAFSKSGIEDFSNLPDSISREFTLSLTLDGERLKAFPLISGMGHRCLLSHFYSVLHGTFFLGHLGRDKRKGIKIEKEQEKLFDGDMSLYIANPQKSTNSLLGPINKFSKVQGKR